MLSEREHVFRNLFLLNSQGDINKGLSIANTLLFIIIVHLLL